MVDQQRKRRIHREGKTEREGGLIHRKLCKDVRDLEVNSFTVGKEFTLNGQIWTSIQIVVKGQGEERKQMRGKKAAINTACSLLQELVSFICGFILPRLILTAFGSKYNGLFNSISQFLGCAILLRSGIGGVTRAALYKPLEEHDQKSINSIIKATDNYMKKIGLILAGLTVAFAAVYALFLRGEFEWLFTFTLVLIIGASKFAESFFGITYLIVLQADQRLWIQSVLYSVALIFNTLISVILIKIGASVHLVKLGSALVFVAYPLIMGAYVKRRYKIDLNVEPNNEAIAQRWDAFWHQVGYFVMENTDIMVLTCFTNMLEVSVYSVYNLIISALKKVLLSFLSGMEAAFGNMIVRKEANTLKETVSIAENAMFSLSTIVYTCTALLICDFVSIYTQGITDVNYIRYEFAYVIIIAQFFNIIRLPYQLVVQAAGHYKQTKAGAIIEPILNIVLSIIFVLIPRFGLTGVAIGTLAATLFRTAQYSLYMSKNVVKRSLMITPARILVAAAEAAAVVVCVKAIHLQPPSNYWDWIINAIITGGICLAVVLAGNTLFFTKDMKNTIKKIRNLKKRSA